MTLLFNRAVAGAATHAFVIGVGDFPYAADGDTEALKNVDNIPSAADSAKLMCDWLLANQDALIAPLASIEVLISDPADGIPRYPWAPGMAIDRATPANVEEAGERWLGNFIPGSSNTAVFYACGHGASVTADPVVFLDELNRRPAKPWPHIAVGDLARALRLNPHVASAYMFVDACGEKIKDFELCPPGNRPPSVFYGATPYEAQGEPKVMLTTAAPEGEYAYDAPLSASFYPPPYAGVAIGRFTQTLIQALNGSSVREWRGRWTVNSTGLRDDLTYLYRFYFPNLTDYPFAPCPILGFNDVRQFVYPIRPVVPIVASTIPAEMIADYEFCIRDAAPPPPPDGGGKKHDPVRKAWFEEIAPRRTSVFAVAFNQNGCFSQPFTPNQPQFDLPVDLQ